MKHLLAKCLKADHKWKVVEAVEDLVEAGAVKVVDTEAAETTVEVVYRDLQEVMVEMAAVMAVVANTVVAAEEVEEDS